MNIQYDKEPITTFKDVRLGGLFKRDKTGCLYVRIHTAQTVSNNNAVVVGDHHNGGLFAFVEDHEKVRIVSNVVVSF